MPRTKHTYLPNEWQEWRQFPSLMKTILKTFPVTTSNIQWTGLQQYNPRVTTTEKQANDFIQSCEIVNEDHIFTSQEGERLVVFLKNGVLRPWKNEFHETLIQTATESIQTLTGSVKSKKAKNDNRHWKNDVPRDDEGVYHLCL